MKPIFKITRQGIQLVQKGDENVYLVTSAAFLNSPFTNFLNKNIFDIFLSRNQKYCSAAMRQ